MLEPSYSPLNSSHRSKRFQRSWAIAIGVAMSIVMLLVWHRSSAHASPGPGGYPTTFSHPGDEMYFSAGPDDLSLLQTLNLSGTTSIHYRRQCIIARPQPHRHASLLEHLDFSFPSHEDAVSIDLSPDALELIDPHHLLPPCQSTGTISIPIPPVQNTSDARELMFGMSTTLSRIEETLPSLSRWLSSHGSPLLVILNDQSSLEPISSHLHRITSTASALNIKILFEPYSGDINDNMGAKNFAILSAFAKHASSSIKWYGVIDDDTFFLSLSRMMSILHTFDSSQPYYIGALSEDYAMVGRAGYMAYGGGGFFLSASLRSTISESDKCQDLNSWYGDMRWRDCIFETTSPTVPLTVLPGLMQMDYMHDASGYYEGPKNQSEILSMHHWKSWYTFPLPEASLMIDLVGQDAFLQRYLLPPVSASPSSSSSSSSLSTSQHTSSSSQHDTSTDDTELYTTTHELDTSYTVFTAGYSIVEYPKGLPDLNLAERTMAVEDISELPGYTIFQHSLGRTRPALVKGEEKISWTLERAVKTREGEVRQFYVKRGWKGRERDVDVVEVDWRVER